MVITSTVLFDTTEEILISEVNLKTGTMRKKQLIGKVNYTQTYLQFDQYLPNINQYTVSSQYLKVKVHPKLLIFQSKFSGSRKFALKYQ